MSRTRHRGYAQRTAGSDVASSAQTVVTANMSAILAAERGQTRVGIGCTHAVGTEIRLGNGTDLHVALGERLRQRPERENYLDAVAGNAAERLGVGTAVQRGTVADGGGTFVVPAANGEGWERGELGNLPAEHSILRRMH